MARSTSFSNASEKYSYVYDEANQLIRENLYYGTGNSNNATITYQYDSWGNLLNKKIYAYTTGTLGTVQETVTYTYGNSSWKDQLTSYNGQSITYDASGNPTSYLGAALVWEGQRLKSYTPASTGSGRVNAYTYNYDENGIRTRKTVGNTVTDYYYNGSLLIGIVQTTTNSDGSTDTSVQRFSYDADGRVLAVNYNGTYYYYLRNAQGDVVKLIDKTGSTVVEYTYDSWGKLLSTSGSLAETFGAEQPFRYRGYVYDEETGFYYLQSRYYNPELGRFISADVYLSTGQGVLGHNAYAYCLNNPIGFEDDCGHAATDAIEFWKEMVDGSTCGGIVIPPVSPSAQLSGVTADAIEMLLAALSAGAIGFSIYQIAKKVSEVASRVEEKVDNLNGEYRYWAATIQKGIVVPVMPLNYSDAQTWVASGKDLLCIDHAAAIGIVKFWPSARWDGRHGCASSGYLNHYHLSSAHGNHILYFGE